MKDTLDEIATAKAIRAKLGVGRRLAYTLIRTAKEDYKAERVTIDQVLTANKLKA
jgi:hypothetical protein